MLRAFRGTVFYNRCRQPPLVCKQFSSLPFLSLTISLLPVVVHAMYIARMRLVSVSLCGPPGEHIRDSNEHDTSDHHDDGDDFQSSLSPLYFFLFLYFFGDG